MIRFQEKTGRSAAGGAPIWHFQPDLSSFDAISKSTSGQDRMPFLFSARKQNPSAFRNSHAAKVSVYAGLAACIAHFPEPQRLAFRRPCFLTTAGLVVSRALSLHPSAESFRRRSSFLITMPGKLLFGKSWAAKKVGVVFTSR